LKRKISFLKNDVNPWSKHQNWKKHETQILINQMLKDKIERKTINHKQKGSNEKKKKLKNKDQIERKKTN
jgi:hypothetical protein